jgi:hypothetical protein
MSITEYVIVSGDQLGLAVFQRGVFVRMDIFGQALAEHVIAFGLLRDPRGARIVVGVARMIAVQVGDRQIRDVLGLIPNCRELALE